MRRVRCLAILIAVLVFSFVRAGAVPVVEISPPRAVSAILIDATSGQVLYELNADAPRPPASIAKIMLELLVVERIEAGRLALADSVTVSGHASKTGGSQVYLKEGEKFTVEDLCKAVAVHSANDACVALAEHVAGSDLGFVDLMNIRARELGLSNTHYVNCHGLDDEPGVGNVTTAREIALLARRLVAMPHVLAWSSIAEEPFRDGQFLLHNTNKLVGRFPGLDGLKTGYTRKAGFCLCATAERDGLRLISVIMGAESERKRFEESARLLGAGFAQLRCERLLASGDPMPGGVPIAGARLERVPVVAGEALSIVLPVSAAAPKPVLIPRGALSAPIARGDTVGVIEATDGNGGTCRVAALAAVDVPRATLWDRFTGLFRHSS